jgi:F0F1-type ATP synthase alpha subunit
MDVKHIRKWERDFLEYLESAPGAVLETIRTKKALDDAATANLKAAIETFRPLFRAE